MPPRRAAKPAQPPQPVLREPYQLGVNNLPGQAGQTATYQFPGLPTGKRLLIETVSLRVHLPPGQLAQATLSTNVFHGSATMAVGTIFFTLSRRGTFDGVDILTASHPTKLYGTGPTPVVFGVQRDAPSGTFGYELFIGGYLEDDTPWPV